jgi:DNA-directed RNA polymerase subunit RPC12/RpoP
MSKAHRKTATWVTDKTTKPGYRKVFQYWHWYDCATCGDRWEMYNEDTDRPRKEFWCPICRARGTNEEEEENKAESH